MQLSLHRGQKASLYPLNKRQSTHSRSWWAVLLQAFVPRGDQTAPGMYGRDVVARDADCVVNKVLERKVLIEDLMEEM